MQIIDLINNKNLGKDFSLVALACRFQIKETRAKARYLDFYLMDKTGELLVRKWNFNDYDQENLINNPNKATVINLLVNKLIYNNKTQYIVENYTINKDLPIENFYLSSPYSVDQMWNELKHFIKLITDKDYQALTQNIFANSKITELFKKQRAAVSYHHNVYGGLLWHTLTMLKVAEKLLVVYDYLKVNVSLLYTAIIMHDLAKIYEIAGFFENKYTFEGRLIGHISLGAQIIHNYAQTLNIPKQKTILLKHCILASHGKSEFGSPVQPTIVEALLLSRIDDLDAKLNMVYKDMLVTSLNNFSENKYPDFANQGFYKHFVTEE